jgi:hypothetical protein
MNLSQFFVQKKLNAAWSAVLTNITRMRPASNVYPRKGEDIFKFDSIPGEHCYKFNVSPIVFVFPERADNLSHKLYIAMDGWLEIYVPDKDHLYTKNFGTQIGYFRDGAKGLEHIYGAHYDIHEALAHPVFHVHIKPQMGLLDAINTHLHKGWQQDTTEDKVLPILSGVRTPTAQMDIFSVVTQICADHLVYKGSNREVQTAFKKICDATFFFTGAAYRMPYLCSDAAKQCYRAPHWYGTR